METAYIASAARTAIGAFNKGFATVSAPELGVAAVQAGLARAGIGAEQVDELVLGQVLTAGSGQNPARQTGINAGIPRERSAYTINQVCGSGLRSVALAAQAVALGDARVVVAGGQENMSLSPHCAHLRTGVKMGDGRMVDTMLVDGLIDAFGGIHMGITAENVAKKWGISRQHQDEFALASQLKAASAIAEGRFAEEITPVTVKSRRGDRVVDQDEFPRETSLEQLAALRPAFDRDGSVTAGNASGLNDGAAALVVCDEASLQSDPLARVVSWASVGVDPEIMGSGPIPASRRALEKAGWEVGDLDLVEANEAFAAQACAVNQDMGWDPDIVNVNGGAIALGHPIGASGARVLVTLLHEMKRRDARKGLATLCIGGGMGIALCVERG